VLGEPDDGDDRPRPTSPPGGSTEGDTAALPDAGGAVDAAAA
jgi:hypothetical protein